MIKTKNLVPEIYYNESRDFQVLGRTYEIIFNYLKSGIDLIKNNPLDRNSDYKLLDLCSRTLGFESKHSYNQNALYALNTSFMTLLRHKGSRQAIEQCVSLLLNAQGLNQKFTLDITDAIVTIYLPIELTDLVLLEDMLDYVLPAGYEYRVVTSNVVPQVDGVRLLTDDFVSAEVLPSSATGQVIKGYIDSVSLVADPILNNSVVNGMSVVGSENDNYSNIRVYSKVQTNPSNDDWSGQYLIVYEDEEKLLNGSVSLVADPDAIDTTNNYQEVTINNGKISIDETNPDNLDYFTIEKVEDGYSIKSSQGVYIGWSQTSSNGLDGNVTWDSRLTNTIEIIDGVTKIMCTKSGKILQYNTSTSQERFRYYDDGKQQPICLYKLVN